MENFAYNTLKIHSSIYDVQRVVEKFSTRHPKKIEKDQEGSVVYVNSLGKKGIYVSEEDQFIFLKTYNDRFDDLILELKGKISGYDMKGHWQQGVPEGYEVSYVDTFVFPDFNKVFPIPTELALFSKQLEDWCVRNWGTRNNPYGCHQEDYNSYSFWSDNNGVENDFGIERCIIKISQEFSDIVFEFSWLDDYYDVMRGPYFLKNGQIINDDWSTSKQKAEIHG